jgi:hypothetical protein
MHARFSPGNPGGEVPVRSRFAQAEELVLGVGLCRAIVLAPLQGRRRIGKGISSITLRIGLVSAKLCDTEDRIIGTLFVLRGNAVTLGNLLC